MQNLFKDEAHQEESSALSDLVARFLAIIIGAITAPLAMAFLTIVWALVFLAGFHLSYPWLQGIFPLLPKVNLWHAWGLVLMLTGLINRRGLSR